MRKFLPVLLLLGACGGDETPNAAELASVADAPASNASAPQEPQPPANAQTAAPAPAAASLAAGPLAVAYEPALLAPVRATIPVPPGWQEKVSGQKLVARDRAPMIGKAECMYGQSGEASLCNGDQEAGLAFATLDRPFDALSAALPAGQRRNVTLAGAQGLSWQIGAEGEGAEYILLPAGARTIMIVRQFRNSGNPDEGAIGRVLAGLRLNAE